MSPRAMWVGVGATAAVVAVSVVLNVVSTSLFDDLNRRPAMVAMWVALGLSVLAAIQTIGLAGAVFLRKGGDRFAVLVACGCVLAPLAVAAVVSNVNLAVAV